MNRLRTISIRCTGMAALISATALARFQIFKGPLNTSYDGDPPVGWNCPPAFISRTMWFKMILELQKPSDKRTTAVKMQVNLVYGFGQIVETWPIRAC
jgi:hypothetical protein